LEQGGTERSNPADSQNANKVSATPDLQLPPIPDFDSRFNEFGLRQDFRWSSDVWRHTHFVRVLKCGAAGPIGHRKAATGAGSIIALNRIQIVQIIQFPRSSRNEFRNHGGVILTSSFNSDSCSFCWAFSFW
jgi:hypothetical protein